MKQTKSMSSVDILEKLISFDTTSRNSNLALIDWVESYLSEYGIAAERVYDDAGTKANLYATIGPADQPGVVLSGHTDTVPVDGQDWSTDPYRLTEKDGRLYGRGTSDMKGYLACCLAQVPAMVEADLQAPIHLAFSYDEEVGCQGVPRLLEALKGRPVIPRACFVGEPTSMQVVIAHKAKRSFRAEFTGKAMHSSQAPDGVNAISYAGRLVNYLDGVADCLASGPRGELFDVPISTAHVGVIRGGTALNIVPDYCRVDFEFRVLPNEDIEALVADMKRFVSEELDAPMRARDNACGVHLQPIAAFPGLDTPPDAAVVDLARELTGQTDYTKVAYGTEAGLFTETLGVPSVVIGPGSIDQAHKPDEYVEERQLNRCDDFLAHLVRRLSTPQSEA